MAEKHRYAAFISYSSKDAAFARRLHRALEAYRIPKSLGDLELTDDPRGRNRPYPCFRDREELASGHLGEGIEKALRDSGSLIVVCSPTAAASPWVEREVRYFESLGRTGRVFAIIAEGEPNAADANAECFPPPLRRGDRAAAGLPEVVAGDARPNRDGFRNAFLKLVAGLAGVNLGQLVDRDSAARRRRLALVWVGSALAPILLFCAFAVADRVQGRVAFREAALRAAEQDPLEHARLLLAAARDPSEVIPSATEADNLLAGSALGAVGIDAYVSLGEWTVAPRGDRFATWPSVSADAPGGAGELRNARNGRLVARMILHRAEFSPASESFVGWRDLESASLYASSTGAQLTDLGGEVHEAAYAPNGARLLTLPGGTLIDARTGATIAQLPHLYPTKRSVSFSADGALFAARTIESGWRVHEAASGRLLASLAVGGGVLLAPNGRRILATDRDPPILDPFEPMETYLNRPFPIATLRDGRGALLASLGPVSAFAFSPDGASLITRFNTLTLWDARDGRRIAAFDKFTNFVWSPASDRLVGYGYTSGALIDSSTGRALTSLAEMERGAASLRWLNANGAGLFSPNGALVAVRGGAGAKLYNARTGAALAEASGALFSPDGRWLFGGGSFYDVAAQRTSFRLQRLDGLSPKTVFSDDSASYFTDIPLKMIALRLDRPLNARPGARRRAQVCGANAASIGAFDQLQRHRRASSALAEHLIGRPWSPCDWRGALSPDGWAQALRYWAVRLGADWDYEEDECAAGARGFGCPKRPDRNR